MAWAVLPSAHAKGYKRAAGEPRAPEPRTHSTRAQCMEGRESLVAAVLSCEQAPADEGHCRESLHFMVVEMEP